MAEPMAFEKLVGSLQVLKQNGAVNEILKGYVVDQQDEREQGKIRFIMSLADVDPTTWKNIVAAVAFEEMVAKYSKDAK